MDTSATNRKIRVLLAAIKDGTLIPRPEFQRRLVWTNKDKKAFIKTVLEGYPFPEIYIASGDVNPDTGEGKELLVDGQQRISTLNQYFGNSKDLYLGKDIPPYNVLRYDDKIAFLEYSIVVRDLGKKSIEEIKQIFQRINSTKYSLNAMEIDNARYDGEFKKFAEGLSEHSFFEKNKVFTSAEIRRMLDVRFVLGIVITMMSTYFNRDDELAKYLNEYNDEFDQKQEVNNQLEGVIKLVESCKFSETSRVWRKSDLFSLMVELHRLAFKEKGLIDAAKIGSNLQLFFDRVDSYEPELSLSTTPEESTFTREDVYAYFTLIQRSTTDRSNRIKRGQIINKIMRESMSEPKAVEQ